MTNVRITNFRRDLVADKAPSTPTRRLKHVAAAPLWIDGRKVESGVVFEETRELAAAEFRELRIN